MGELTVMHADKTKIKMPNAKGSTEISKIERYNWSKLKPQGTFMMINKRDLLLDESYQREEESKIKIAKIVRSWDWMLFGVLSVVIREDNKMYIYDGGHRWRASWYRDDVNELPCLIFEVASTKVEAGAFIGTNTLHKNVSAYDLFKARLLAEDPTAMMSAKILLDHGYMATKNTRKYGFKGLSELQKQVEKNPAIASRVFSACAMISKDGGVIHASVLRALFYLEERSTSKICTPENVKKLSIYGMDGIIVSMQRERHLQGKGGVRIESLALLSLINKGKLKRNRILLEDSA